MKPDRSRLLKISSVIYLLVITCSLMLFAESSFSQSSMKKILWREDVFDRELSDTMSKIILDSAYFSSVTESEKAAIGYAATFVGNECWWDGQDSRDRTNLKCKIISALGLGYQCSETHLGFLRHWFREDGKALEKLEDCPTTPFTATVQEVFDSIKIAVQGELITLHLSVTGMNLREELDWKRDEEIVFRRIRDGLVIESESGID